MENTPGMRHRGAFTFCLAPSVFRLGSVSGSSWRWSGTCPTASGAAGLHHVPSGRRAARVELFYLGTLGSRTFNGWRRASPRERRQKDHGRRRQKIDLGGRARSVNLGGLVQLAALGLQEVTRGNLGVQKKNAGGNGLSARCALGCLPGGRGKEEQKASEGDGEGKKACRMARWPDCFFMPSEKQKTPPARLCDRPNPH